MKNTSPASSPVSLEINVGLDRSARFDVSGRNELGDVLGSLSRVVDLLEVASLPAIPGGEPTVWARVAYKGIGTVLALHDVAGELCQDCISIRFADGTGDMVGPFRSQWPAFDAKFFRRPEFHPAPIDTSELKLFVWRDFAPDWTGGLAVAIASSEEDARAQIAALYDNGPVDDWGTLEVHPLDKPFAGFVSGGS